jgi:hypothetical protein
MSKRPLQPDANLFGFARIRCQPFDDLSRQRHTEAEIGTRRSERSVPPKKYSDYGVESMEQEYDRGESNVLNDSSSEESDSLSVYAESDDSDSIACNFCGCPNNWKELMQCGLCKEWIHLKCYNARFGTNLAGIPNDDIICTSHDSCMKKYSDAVEIGYFEDVDGLLDTSTNEGSKSDGCDRLQGDIDELQAWFACSNEEQARVENTAEIPSQIAAHRLAKLINAKPLVLSAVQHWTESFVSMSETVYGSIVDGFTQVFHSKNLAWTELHKKAVLDAAPPQNIRRTLEACGDGRIKTVTLMHSFKSIGVDVLQEFHYRDPLDAAMEVHFSLKARSHGVFTDTTSTRCGTGRMPNLKEKVEQFAAHVGFDCKDSSNLTLVLGLYSDDSRSSSGNVEFCPCWLTDVTMDPSIRFMLKEGAHSLLGMFPVASSLEYRFSPQSGRCGSASLAALRLSKNQRYKALLDLRNQALETILKGILDTEEEGRAYVVDGTRYTVRVLVLWYAADMKERRVLLGLRRGVYDCTRCYAFPGHVNADEIERGPRSQATDKRIRKEFRDGVSRVAKDVAKSKDAMFKEQYGHLGLNLSDTCPFTRAEMSRIFTVNGPYELFNFDSLHNKDGVILYYFDFLETFIGKDFLQVTQGFGNEFLKTKRFSMHVMERGIESFHFIPLAIALGQFKQPLSVENRCHLFKGSCDLLKILNLLRDPCPCYILSELRQIVSSFKLHVTWLLEKLAERKISGHKVTTKMHELFEHACDQIETNGFVDAFSTKLYESFHQKIKRLFQVSSKRRTNGSAQREILLSLFYIRVVDEVNSLLLPCQQVTSTPQRAPLVPHAVFIVANDVPQLSAEALVRRNLHVVLRTLFAAQQEVAGLVFPSIPGMRTGYGSTLRMWIQCQSRQVPLTNEAVAVVPGVLKGEQQSGASFNAIVFKDDSLEFDVPESNPFVGNVSWQKCGIAGCNDRHHLEHVQLFCSAARDKDSSFGIPVLFFKSFTILLPLHRVKPSASGLWDHSAVFEAECHLEFRVVMNTNIRGICMVRPNYDDEKTMRCFVFPGRGTFGHSIVG